MYFSFAFTYDIFFVHSKFPKNVCQLKRFSNLVSLRSFDFWTYNFGILHSSKIPLLPICNFATLTAL